MLAQCGFHIIFILHFEPNLLVLFYGNLLPSRQRSASELVFSVSIVFAIVTFVVNDCYCTHGSFFGDV